MFSRWCDGSVTFLSCCIPDLSFYGFAVHLDAAGRKFHPDSALALQIELIPSEAGQQITLSYSGVANKHHYNRDKQRNIRLLFPFWRISKPLSGYKTIFIVKM